MSFTWTSTLSAKLYLYPVGSLGLSEIGYISVDSSRLAFGVLGKSTRLLPQAGVGYLR